MTAGRDKSGARGARVFVGDLQQRARDFAGGDGRRRTSVFVVGVSAVGAARVEALLAGDKALDVSVVDAATLAVLATDQDPAVVVIATPAQMTARLVEQFHGRPRAPAFVVLTAAPQEAWTARARRSGVRAVLSRDATAEELSAAVAATAAGLLVLHPDALSRTRAARARGEPRELTPRELEILEAMAEGLSNRAIAARLKISRHTVKFHVGAILAKLGARTRAEAVTVGVRRGVLSL
jgi:DNA-binding NarL/FixJ family response regulator